MKNKRNLGTNNSHLCNTGLIPNVQSVSLVSIVLNNPPVRFFDQRMVTCLDNGAAQWDERSCQKTGSSMPKSSKKPFPLPPEPY